jgi:hypothetical protein
MVSSGDVGDNPKAAHGCPSEFCAVVPGYGLPPLPVGEGWGEGKPAAGRHSASLTLTLPPLGEGISWIPRRNTVTHTRSALLSVTFYVTPALSRFSRPLGQTPRSFFSLTRSRLRAKVSRVTERLFGSHYPLAEGRLAAPIDGADTGHEESHASWTNQGVFNDHGWLWSHGGTF